MTRPVKQQTTLRVQCLGDNDDPSGLPITFRGREAWACRELIRAGDAGVSSLHHIGPRLAHYCMKIRRAGILIETVKQPHGGPYVGWHGVYKLRTKLDVIEDNTGAAA